MTITVSNFVGAFLVVAITLSIIAGVFWKMDIDSKRDKLLESGRGYIRIDDDGVECERVDYRGTNSLGTHLIDCIGADFK